MLKYKFASIAEFNCYRAYLREVLKQNERGRFSQRQLSKKLKWPASFLSDLLTGRKNLSLQRALQLAEAAKFDVFDTERLILLALAETKEKAVAEHFTQELKNRETPARAEGQGLDSAMFQRLEMLAVHDTLRWAGRALPAKEIVELLYTFGDDLTEATVEAAIVELEQRGILRLRPDGSLDVLINEIYFDDPDSAGHDEMNAAIHGAYARNLRRYLRVQRWPRVLFSGFINLPATRSQEIKVKIEALRNWLINLERNLRPGEAAQLFQFDFNLFPLITMDSATAEAHRTRNW